MWVRRVILAFLLLEYVVCGPILGPSEVVFKYLEKCKWTSPKLLRHFDIRLYQRRGKLVLDVNATFPFPFSDNIGYDMNVAVKRNGGWISNFLKFKGKGACSGVVGEKNLFKILAKELKAPDPPHCPLPAGTINIYYVGADPSASMRQLGLEVMPYGEFKVLANFTYQEDIVLCVKAFIDLVPKKGKSG